MADTGESLVCNCEDDEQYFCPVHFGLKRYLNKNRLPPWERAVHETVELSDKMVKYRYNSLGNPTKTEDKLYSILVDLHILNFEKEWWIGKFRADMYLPNFGIIIEANGGYHKTREKTDEEKYSLFESLGLLVYPKDNKYINKEWVVNILTEYVLNHKCTPRKYWDDIIINYNKIVEK